MAPQAEGLDDDTVLALAAHFAALPARANDGPADPELMARSRVMCRHPEHPPGQCQSKST